MEKEHVYTFLTVLCSVLAVLFGYMASNVKSKKEELTPKKDPVNLESPVIFNIKGDYVNGQKIDEHKIEPKGSNKQEVHNNPNALIITNNQSGGQNTVNYSGGKLNPANLTNKPIFDENGYYGLSILNEKCKTLQKETAYSFSAKIPVNTKLKVVIKRIGEDKNPLWFMKVGSEKNWRYNLYDNSKDFSQQFDLDDEFGDLYIIFRESGEAKIKIFYNDSLIEEKNIKWG